MTQNPAKHQEDKRLIEDYLPIVAISAEASREKSVRKGHISTLHLWWARRPLVACRAAVYGALVPASRFVPENGPDNKKQSLGRANAAKFVTDLCKYPGDTHTIQEAQRHILEAHAERLTQELAAWKAGSTPKPGWVDEFKFKGNKVTVEDIIAERAPRPRVLDMFAGGGAIPLEALRLGCEAYALDLNPVAHIIQLCTLVYPQKYGKPDPAARGMTGLPAPRRFWVYVIRCDDESFYIGQTDNIVRRYEDHLNGKAEWTAVHKPVELIHWEEFNTREKAVAREQDLKTGFGRKWLKREWDAERLAARQAGPKNEKGLPASLEGLAQPGETTWGGLAEEVRYWGNWVLKNVKAEIGDLYPLIPDPNAKPERLDGKTFLPGMDTGDALTTQPGFLMPVAYLWTRTVKCKNPACGATVPLVRQTWLRKKEGRYVAMKMVAPKGKKEVHFEIMEARTAAGLGFDPEAFSKAGNAACPFCGTVADSDYVMAEGCSQRRGEQLMCVVAKKPDVPGKIYLSADDSADLVPESGSLSARIRRLCEKSGITVPDEPIGRLRPSPNARGLSPVTRHGFFTFADLYTKRQLLCLLTYANTIAEIPRDGDADRHRAIKVCLSLILDRVADYCSNFCQWRNNLETVGHTFARHALAMLWDFAEGSPLFGASGTWSGMMKQTCETLSTLGCEFNLPACTQRGSAFSLPWQDSSLDAVVTDPPYYDNIPYADVSDFFYVWLKRSIGLELPEHFSSPLTPKKAEATALSARHGGDFKRATDEYESIMEASFREAYRVLKSQASLTIVYAHKTTLGWATLVNALRLSGFTVTEAWPLNTEMGVRLIAQNTAALTSSIFLVARKRDLSSKVGNYETDVVQELGSIVRERVETLWEMGISGADLVIACVGAGLRAFTKYARVEYGNGEEVPAERFLAEVETVVLETILGKLSKTIGGKGSETSLAGLDPATRFYVLWRYTYGAAELDAGEAIIFANGTHVELDGQHSLTQGTHALLEKKKNKYCLHDFTERGKYEKLGIPEESQTESPHRSAVDALHRLLWLLEHKPPKVPEFLNDVKPNIEQLRLIAQALAGPALKGGELADVSPTAEQSALGKLLANWNAIMVGKAVVEDRRAGQPRLFNK